MHLREIESGSGPIDYSLSHLQAMAKLYSSQDLMRVIWRDDNDLLRAATSFIDGWSKVLGVPSNSSDMNVEDWQELFAAMRELQPYVELADGTV